MHALSCSRTCSSLRALGNGRAPRQSWECVRVEDWRSVWMMGRDGLDGLTSDHRIGAGKKG